MTAIGLCGDCGTSVLLRHCVAGGDIAGFKSAPEPVGALGGGPVGERLGTYMSSGHFLQAVVAYGGNGLHAGSDIG